MPPAPRPHVPRLLLWIGGAAIAWGVAAWITGGVAFTIAGVRMSSRGADRPLVAGAVLVVLGLWALPRADRRALLLAVATRTERAAPWLAAALAVGLTGVSAIFGIHAASGADSAGYLSESRVLARGRLTVDAPPITAQRWPDRGWMAAPFGFAPAPEPDVLAPTYAQGLPLLMAAGAAVAGEAGRFVWTPLFAGLLAATTYWFTRRHAPATVALASVLLVASSPPLLFAAMQTMSDVLVSALWTGVLLRLAAPGLAGAMATGGLSALALLIRPNLALVAAALWAVSLVASADPRPIRLRRAAVQALPIALAAVAVAVVNTRLWGSPASSGYGDASALYAWDTVPANLAALWRWTRETGGYAMAAGAVVALAFAVRDRAWRPAAVLVAAVLASYVPYFVFAEWWYLRFYLPLWPVASAGAAAGAWLTLRRWTPDAAALVVLATAAGLAAAAVTMAERAHTFDLWRGEQRYPAVAAYLAEHASTRAVLVSVQHSGALSYYTGRAIARYDHLDGDALDAQCEAWRADGRDVWLVVEEWEAAEFRARFAGQHRGALGWAPDAEARIGPARVRVYDLDTPTRQVAPALIPVAPHGVWPWRRLWTPAASQ